MSKPKLVKCVVWDLDNTLWDGVLLEHDAVAPRAVAVDVIRALDERGILHSIASRNEPGLALAKLTELGLQEYFLHPQIGWNAKSASVRAVAEALNIGVDTLAFVDDEPYEREEVRSALPSVICVDAREVGGLLARSEFTPTSVTDDARRRRKLYQANAARVAEETAHTGPAEDFLAGLGMRLRIAPAGPDDLARAEELTVRTNQLNTTGYTYSYQELDAFRTASDHLLLTAELTDRFGPYGTIGLALIAVGEQEWTVKLLLMSCRVMSRGVGSVLINHVKGLARDAGARLLAEFVPTDRNRMMFVSYRFAGFREVGRRDEVKLLEADLTDVPPHPPYLTVDVPTV